MSATPLCEVVQYTDFSQFLVWVLTTPRCFQNPWGVARSPSFFMPWKCQFCIWNLEKKWPFFHSILEKLFLISSRSLNKLSRPLQDTKTQKLSLNFRGLQPHCARALNQFWFFLIIQPFAIISIHFDPLNLFYLTD